MEKHPILNPRVETRRNPGKLVRSVITAGAVGSAATLGLMAKEGYDYTKQFPYIQESLPETETVEADDDKTEHINDVEMIAEDLPSSVFDNVINGYTIVAGGMGRDEVFVKGKFDQPIKGLGPIELPDESRGYRRDEMTWRFEGAGPVGIPGELIREIKSAVSDEFNIPIHEISVHHVYLDLTSTKAELMNSMVELAYTNATTPLANEPEGRDALSIIRLETNFTQLSPRVEEEFTPYMIGIAAEESRFDVNKTSKSGAVGLLQTMPRTFEGFKDKYNLPNLNPRDLHDQLPVGLDHIETSYLELTKKLDLELNYITKVYFDGNTASMERYFLVPLMINSYNAGQGRMIEVVRWFLETYTEPESTAELLEQDEPLTGYDVFFAMTHQCAKEKAVEGYGPETSVYTAKVMGWEKAFNEYEQKQQEVQVASN